MAVISVPKTNINTRISRPSHVKDSNGWSNSGSKVNTNTVINRASRVKGPNGEESSLFHTEPDNIIVIRQYLGNGKTLADVQKVTTSLAPKAKTVEGLMKLFNNLKTYNIPLNNQIYAAVIKRLGELATTQPLKDVERLNAVDKALELFEEMKQNNIEPDIHTYNIIITACGNNKRLDKALEIFNELKGKGLLSQYTYNTIMSMCCKNGDLEQALVFFVEMVQNGFQPDNISFNTIISAYVKINQYQQANEFFEQALKSGIKPDIVMYSTMITVHGNNDNWEKALNIFKGLEKKGFVLNLVAYNSILSAAEKAGEIKFRQYILHKMKLSGIAFDDITYGIVMSAYDKAGMVREMIDLVKDIKNNNITMNYIHYSLIIGAYYKNKSWGQALHFFNMAVKDGVCKANLGYDSKNNALNFHLDAVFNLPANRGDHVEGVSRDLARALFKYHMDRGKITVGTTLIVGYRGLDTLKNLFISIIEEELPNFKYKIPDNNLGVIILA